MTERRSLQMVKRLMYASSIAPALIILFITPLRAQAQIEGELIREAKKEARVVYWTTMRAPDAQALAQGFEAKYPFVKAEIVRISGDQLIERAITENPRAKSPPMFWTRFPSKFFRTGACCNPLRHLKRRFIPPTIKTRKVSGSRFTALTT